MPVQDEDVLELTVIHDNDVSGEVINRFQYRIDTPTPVEDANVLEDIADLIEVLYNIVSHMIAIANVFREVRVHNVTQDRLMGSTDAGTYTGGESAGDDMPQGTAGYFHFTTAVPRVILSKYLPPSTEGDKSTDGKPTTASMALMAAMVTAMLVGHTSGTAHYDYGHFSPKVLAWVVPQVGTVSSLYAYQRRRKPGRGA